MKVNGIQLAWIVVSDLAAAIKFYTEIVGLTLCERHDQFGWAELSGPTGARLGISQQAPHTDHKAGTNAVVTLTVDDLQQARKELEQKKTRLIGEVVEVPGEVKMQTFCDPDGNTFQLCQLLK
jgi:predicted enzyme related to lactoylglutathione lyase